MRISCVDAILYKSVQDIRTHLSGTGHGTDGTDGTYGMG